MTISPDEDKDNHGHEIDASNQESLPYNRGSETSKEAAEAKKETRARDEARVLNFLRSRGEEGATDYEIEKSTGLRQSSASARRNGLVKKGLVRDSGMKRKTSTGQRAIVWILGTGTAVRGSGNERISRPSPAKLRDALVSINQIMSHSEATHGPRPEVALHETLRWLSKLARQQDALTLGIVVQEPKEKDESEEQQASDGDRQ